MAIDKKLIPVAVALGVAALFIYMTFYGPTNTEPAVQAGAPTTATLRIGTATVVAEVASTNEQRALGLGGRTSLAEDSGMWFVFEQDGEWGFWMKDTRIPLDILWVAADGTIITIAHDVKPESYPEVFTPTAPARYVLEVPAGFAVRNGVAQGDKVEF